MTAFSEQERAMMWGIYGELETMNRNLTNLAELLERQGQERVTCIMPSCPNPRFTESGHCHHHRYLRGS